MPIFMMNDRDLQNEIEQTRLDIAHTIRHGDPNRAGVLEGYLQKLIAERAERRQGS